MLFDIVLVWDWCRTEALRSYQLLTRLIAVRLGIDQTILLIAPGQEHPGRIIISILLRLPPPSTSVGPVKDREAWHSDSKLSAGYALVLFTGLNCATAVALAS